MTDKELLERALDHIKCLISAVNHAEQFGTESATGCRDRARIKTQAFNFIKECSHDSSDSSIN